MINTTGKGYYRIKLPYAWIDRYIDDINVTIYVQPDLRGFNPNQLLAKTDILVIQGIIGADLEFYPNLIKICNDNHVPVIYDIDDLDWEVSRENPAYGHFKKYNVGDYIKKCLKTANVVTTTTQRISSEIREFSNKVYTIPNAIDYDYYYWNLPKTDDGFIKVGICTGGSHMHDINLIKGLGKWLLDTYKNVKFILGGYDSRMLNPKPGAIVYHDGNQNVWYHYIKALFTDDTDWSRVEIRRTEDVEMYPRLFQDIDIILAPMTNNRFNRSKSNLKAIEASAIPAAFIGSDVWEYKNNIIHCINGYLVRIPSDWKRYLKKLIEEPETRKRMAERLHNDYKKEFDINIQSEKRAEIIRELYNKYSTIRKSESLHKLTKAKEKRKEPVVA